ncbi:hypothetical protein JKP88DRAFT_178328 [Tribonema minus]|uniref:Uncharacterized protein n=1 Tax=Tribonema minus TaxID=303371 RepID=A0A836CLV0_9STRA|nr:hypothetical protein JKP88DRAFT_178328 [Tribonema minus]
MRARSAVITGIARNNAQHLGATLALVDAIGALFASYAVVLYENDSTDETPAMIEAWRAANRGGAARIDFISEQLNTVFPMDLGGFAEERFRLLADCRNKCLDVLRGPEYDAFSHVIVLDMDLYDFDLDGLAHSFGAHDAWDAVSANGYFMLGDNEYYYDTLAFRTAEFPDTWHSDAQRDAAHRSYDEAMPLVPVNSAFGGLAVYKRRCLVQCRYSGLDCEHVALHHCLQQTAGCRRLFMNPAMKLNYHLWD